MSIVIGPLFVILDAALGLYIWVVIAAAVMSWLIAFNVVNTRSRFVYSVGDMLYRLTNPALRQIRRIVPSIGGVDISAVILILALQFLSMVLAQVAARVLHGGF